MFIIRDMLHWMHCSSSYLQDYRNGFRYAAMSGPKMR
jgi:hypothetical protein